MKKTVKKLSLLLTIILLTGCKNNILPNDVFSYEEPDSFEAPTLNPSDFGFEQNDTLKNTISSIGKTGGAVLTSAELNNVLNVISTNDMRPNKMQRETIDSILYDYGHNDLPSGIIFDEGNVVLAETENLIRDDVACKISGDLTYFKDVFDSSEEGAETDIDVTGQYKLEADMATVSFIESRIYEDASLNISKHNFFTISGYKAKLNLVQSKNFLTGMSSVLSNPNFNDYVKTGGATIDEGVVNIVSILSKTISTGASTSMTYTIKHELVVEEGMVVKTDYHYLEKDEEEKIVREERDLKIFSLVTE